MVRGFQFLCKNGKTALSFNIWDSDVAELIGFTKGKSYAVVDIERKKIDNIFSVRYVNKIRVIRVYLHFEEE